MPITVHCPDCNAAVPLAEIVPTVPVECPRCDSEFTAASDQPGATRPVARAGAAVARASAAARAAAREQGGEEDALDELREKRSRAAGGSWAVVAVGGLALLLVLAGIGFTAHLIATDKGRAVVLNPPRSNAGPGRNTHPPPVLNPITPAPRPGELDPIRPNPNPADPVERSGPTKAGRRGGRP
jgi:hypothetical protein